MQNILEYTSKLVLRCGNQLHHAWLLRVVPAPASRRFSRCKTPWGALYHQPDTLQTLREFRVTFDRSEKRLVGFLIMPLARNAWIGF
jgi:hypothetical protein